MGNVMETVCVSKRNDKENDLPCQNKPKLKQKIKKQNSGLQISVKLSNNTNKINSSQIRVKDVEIGLQKVYEDLITSDIYQSHDFFVKSCYKDEETLNKKKSVNKFTADQSEQFLKESIGEDCIQDIQKSCLAKYQCYSQNIILEDNSEKSSKQFFEDNINQSFQHEIIVEDFYEQVIDYILEDFTLQKNYLTFTPIKHKKVYEDSPFLIQNSKKLKQLAKDNFITNFTNEKFLDKNLYSDLII